MVGGETAIRRRVQVSIDRQVLEDITFLLMAAALDHRATDQSTMASATFERLFELLLKALPRVEPEKSPAATNFMLARCLFGALAAASDIQSRQLIDRGADLERLILPLFPKPPAERQDPLKLSERNNHLAMSALLALAWGKLTENSAYLAAAEEAVVRYASSIDANGVPVYEASRGASAAWYVNLCIMLLTTYCWLAGSGASGKVDPSVTSALKRAVPFLNLAIQRPTILHGYAKQNLYPNPAHGSNPLRTDLGFLQGYHSSRHYLSWLPVYLHITNDQDGPAMLLQKWTESRDLFPKGSEFSAGFPIRHLNVSRIVG